MKIVRLMKECQLRYKVLFLLVAINNFNLINVLSTIYLECLTFQLWKIQR